MDVSEAIRTRRSVRRYSDAVVERQVLRKLVEAGCWAPTAGNAQTWRFVVVTDSVRMRKPTSSSSAAGSCSRSRLLMIRLEEAHAVDVSGWRRWRRLGVSDSNEQQRYDVLGKAQ